MLNSISNNLIDTFGDRAYLIISIIIILIAIAAFLFAFEKGKPKTRDVVLISIMISLAVVGRLVFFMLPQFKPCAAIIIITGVMLGRQAGFLSGVMTAFISDFFFGMGPWTPWQMIAFGIIGLLAAILFNEKRIEKMGDWGITLLCIYGFLSTFIIYGLIMDTANVLMITDKPRWTSLLASYAAGLVFNLIHGGSTLIFLWILAKPMYKKLKRIKKKFKGRAV